jgi:hypothetical protein
MEEKELRPMATTSKTSRTLLPAIALVALAAGGPVVAHDRGAGRAGKGETRVYTLDPSTHGNPEGIAFDETTGAFFVGATGDGTIYRGTLDDPVVTEFIPGTPERQAAGLKVFRGKLYVAGGFLGTVLVYDIATRDLLASFGSFGAGMLNDLVVTGPGTSSSPTRSSPRCGTSRRRRWPRAGAPRKASRSSRRSSTTTAPSPSTSTASWRSRAAGRSSS